MYLFFYVLDSNSSSCPNTDVSSDIIDFNQNNIKKISTDVINDLNISPGITELLGNEINNYNSIHSAEFSDLLNTGSLFIL